MKPPRSLPDDGDPDQLKAALMQASVVDLFYDDEDDDVAEDLRGIYVRVNGRQQFVRRNAPAPIAGVQAVDHALCLKKVARTLVELRPITFVFMPWRVQFRARLRAIAKRRHINVVVPRKFKLMPDHLDYDALRRQQQ